MKMPSTKLSCRPGGTASLIMFQLVKIVGMVSLFTRYRTQGQLDSNLMWQRKLSAFQKGMGALETIAMITHVWYFGGLGQAMIYALVDVWTSLSRMGVPFDPHGKDCVEIPVTIFAGKRQSKSRTNQQAQYVAASLMIPRTCGELFKYTINSFEPFGRDLQKTLVSLYLESCLHGLESAVAAHKTKLPDGTTKEWMESPYLPHPLCGLELPFGNGSFTLIGSPVPKGKFANSSSFTSPTQADLWEGTAT